MEKMPGSLNVHEALGYHSCPKLEVLRHNWFAMFSAFAIERSSVLEGAWNYFGQNCMELRQRPWQHDRSHALLQMQIQQQIMTLLQLLQQLASFFQVHGRFHRHSRRNVRFLPRLAVMMRVPSL